MNFFVTFSLKNMNSERLHRTGSRFKMISYSPMNLTMSFARIFIHKLPLISRIPILLVIRLQSARVSCCHKLRGLNLKFQVPIFVCLLNLVYESNQTRKRLSIYCWKWDLFRVMLPRSTLKFSPLQVACYDLFITRMFLLTFIKLNMTVIIQLLSRQSRLHIWKRLFHFQATFTC